MGFAHVQQHLHQSIKVKAFEGSRTLTLKATWKYLFGVTAAWCPAGSWARVSSLVLLVIFEAQGKIPKSLLSPAWLAPERSLYVFCLFWRAQAGPGRPSSGSPCLSSPGWRATPPNNPVPSMKTQQLPLPPPPASPSSSSWRG